jgi:hexosaminidase
MTGGPDIVPRPRSVRSQPGGASLADGMVVAAEPSCAGVAQLLAGELAAATGWNVRTGDAGETSPGGTVRLLVRPGSGSVGVAGTPNTAGEGYSLRIGDGAVEIAGLSPAGTFYGTRTLRQLMAPELLRAAPARTAGPVQMEGLFIEDAPRFGWRGLLLDVARHFFPKTFLLRLVDLASLHKLNVLHLHLTDDQGWRVELDGYPRLTEVGAWRRASPLGHQRERKKDGVPHGGYYRKADLAEVAAYAARRFVTLVPEVDMPGHTQAMLAAYPELGNTGLHFPVSTDWGISEHVLNMEESTADFCAGVLDEVMGAFPSPYFHIGGDECPTSEWDASARALELCRQRGLSEVRALQGWFTARMADVVAARGRTLVCWEEVLDAGAPPGCVVAAWRAESAVLAAQRAVSSGHGVIMVPEPFVYFDWAYADDPAEPLAIRPAISVEKAYSFDPVPAELGPELGAGVLGGQCQLWTEYVPTPEHAEYMLWPRACAFAEVGWSGPGGEWAGFERRLAPHLGRLAALGVNYRPLSGPTPGQARVWPAGLP